jgi:heavy metal efflux system protein
MIAQLARWSIANRVSVVVATAVFIVATGFAAFHLKLDALPDVTANQVLVLTRAPGLVPEEVERRVTRPIEAALGGLPGIESHRSLSRYGISSITVVFEDGIDPYRARQLVAERVAIVSGVLPRGVDAPELGPLSGGLGEVFQFVLTSPTRTPAELLELGEFRLGPLLRSIPGVVEVNTWGGGRRTFEIAADANKLANRHLTLRALTEALREATGAVAGAGLASPGGTRTLLRGSALPSTPADLAAVVLDVGPATDGDQSQHLVRLGDVASVREGRLPSMGAATAAGRGEAVYLMVQMLRDANALELMDAIAQQMPQLRSQLPADVALDVVYDRSILVKNTLRTVAFNLLEGGALVALVLLLTLGSFRAGLLVAAAIPLSMLGATAAMVLVGIPGNLMSLGAIDFGLVVDGAVVMIERIFHAFHTRRSEASRHTTMADAVSGVARPMFFGVLIILLVYVPIVSLTGVDGKMFRPMALTVVFALGISLVLALTFVPAAAAIFLRPKHVSEQVPWVLRIVVRIYEPVLSAVRVRGPLIATGAILMLIAGGWLFTQLGRAFVPQLDEGDLVIQTTRTPDIDLPEAVLRATELERTVQAVAPEVEFAYSRVGSPTVATDIMGYEQADVFVRLKPKSQWRQGLSRDSLLGQIEGALKKSEVATEVVLTQPIQMRFNELLGGAPTDVTVAVFGEDLTVLRSIGEAVVKAVSPISGVADALVMSPPEVAIVEVVPNPLHARSIGFSNADILQAVEATGVGVDVGVAYDGPVRIPIRLRLGEAPGSDQFGQHALPMATGGTVPFSRVATLVRRKTPSLVNHDRGQRRLMVGFNVRGSDLGTVVDLARTAVNATVRMPDGVHLQWGGQVEAMQAATRRLSFVIPFVILVILLLLVWTFGQLRPALIILIHVPFAGVGGLALLALRGLPISISAVVGFIALSGIAVLNGIVLLAEALKEQSRGMDPGSAMAHAALLRVRPVLMTALVAALGFIPMALATGVGSEVQRPLATVVVGGLFTSTLLTLVVLPAVYPWLAGGRRKVSLQA